ncbi:hypothetical protein ACRAWG_30810 [Methylobacterium sp. P31]
MSVAKAFLVHCLPMRLRIVIPSRRGDRVYFVHLQRTLSKLPDVIRIGINPIAASVVVHCQTGFDPECLNGQGLALMPIRETTRPDLIRMPDRPAQTPGSPPIWLPSSASWCSRSQRARSARRSWTRASG